MIGFEEALDRLPWGSFKARFEGTLWRVARTRHVAGRSEKLVAHDLRGSGYVSMNFYHLSGGRTLLRPCEMSESWVRQFVSGVVPIDER